MLGNEDAIETFFRVWEGKNSLAMSSLKSSSLSNKKWEFYLYELSMEFSLSQKKGNSLYMSSLWSSLSMRERAREKERACTQARARESPLYGRALKVIQTVVLYNYIESLIYGSFI
jgi:hypothetical protein